MKTPHVGQMVHYWDLAVDPPIAAVVTFVHDGGAVDLTVFRPCDLEHEYLEVVAQFDKPRAGRWTVIE